MPLPKISKLDDYQFDNSFVVILDGREYAALLQIAPILQYAALWLDGYEPHTAESIIAKIIEGEKVSEIVTAIDNLSAQLQTDAAQQVQALQSINTALLELQNVTAAIATIQSAVAGTDLEDDLANVWSMLSSIGTVLGATLNAPPPPL